MDTGDNTLTSEKEKSVPEKYQEIYKKFSPEGYVPAFVFGNQYYRVGNGYEAQKNLAAEKAEFQKLIEELIQSSNNAS